MQRQSEATTARKAFSAITIGVLLSILSVMLTAYDPLWEAFGVARDLRGAQSTGLSILFVSLGFLTAFYFQQRDFQEALLGQQRRSAADLLQVIPNANLFSRYTGDEAMRIIATQLPISRYALNTRIFPDKLNPTRNVGFREWDISLRTAVRQGLTYKDVISSGNQALAEDRCRAVQGGSGEYDAVIIQHELPSFLNFIVLESRTGVKEVWFGWLISRGTGFAETNVIRTSELRIVSAFEQWHRELFATGTSVTVDGG